MTDVIPSKSSRAKILPYKIIFEPRLTQPPSWYPVFVSILALFVALIIGGIIIIFAGGDPILSYKHIAEASFGNLGVLSDTFVKATPILFTALACSIAFRMKLPRSWALKALCVSTHGSGFTATSIRHSWMASPGTTCQPDPY